MTWSLFAAQRIAALFSSPSKFWKILTIFNKENVTIFNRKTVLDREVASRPINPEGDDQHDCIVLEAA